MNCQVFISSFGLILIFHSPPPRTSPHPGTLCSSRSLLHGDAVWVPFVTLAGCFIRISLVLSVLFIDAVVGQVHELVAEALHGRGVPASEEEEGRGKKVTWQSDNGPNISPDPQEVKDKGQILSDAQEPQSTSVGKVARTPQLSSSPLSTSVP